MKRALTFGCFAALVFISFGVGRASNDQRDVTAVNYSTPATPMADVCFFYGDITDVQPAETLLLDNWYSILIENLVRLHALAVKSRVDVLAQDAADLVLAVVTGDMLLEQNARASLLKDCEPSGTVRLL